MRIRRNYGISGDFSLAIMLGALLLVGYMSLNAKRVLEDIAGVHQNSPQVIDRK